MTAVGDHAFTVIAYTGVAVAIAWWFWRTQRGATSRRIHAVVAVVFGLLWPAALLYRAAVRTAVHAIARYRLRRRNETKDDPSDALNR